MAKGKKKQRWVEISEDMPRLNPNAAGIDVGATEMWVAVPTSRDAKPVQRFEAFTRDLCALADWLKRCRIETVAMESTGIYWIPLFQILEERGFEVTLVNAKYAKNVAGRKTDMLDCQWLQVLHTYGLLSGSFRPADEMCVLRSYMRQRQMLIEYGAGHVQHIQKALSQMNLQLGAVISDVVGVTGMRIVRAILKGERDPHRLAAMRDLRTKNDEETIAKALEGDYRAEHIFSLRQAVELFDFYQRQISECDKQIADYLRRLESKIDTQTHPLQSPRSKKNNRRNTPGFDCRHEAYRISGVDLTQIDGISESAALTILSEIGTDMNPWKTEKNFASWLSLCPNNKITGGKIFQSRTRKSANRVRDLLRVCSQSLFNSQSALGAFARRMRSRLGPEKAIVATAHKMALLIYRMIKLGKDYVDIGQDAYERQYKDRMVKNLARKAKQLGFQLMPSPQTP
jgi:transposase